MSNVVKNKANVSAKADEKPEELTAEMVQSLIEDAKNEFRKETKEIEKQVLLERASLITIFGLFASITSFLIIEFQCLKTVSSIWGIVGFSCVIFALLLGFNIGLDYLIKSRFDKDGQNSRGIRNYIAFVGIIFAIGCGGIYLSEKQTSACASHRQTPKIDLTGALSSSDEKAETIHQKKEII